MKRSIVAAGLLLVMGCSPPSPEPPSKWGQVPPVVPDTGRPVGETGPRLTVAAGPAKDGVLETALTDTSPPDDAEPWVAANPADPENFVVGGISWSEGQTILVAATLDGGKTWHRTALPRAADATFHADPVVAFDANGIAYLADIPASVSGTSGVPLGIEVTRSLDGGLTWDPPQRISANQGKDDKTAIAVDTQPGSPWFGRVYVAWKWPGGNINMSYSDNQGGYYVTPYVISSDAVSGLSMAVERDGRVLLAANRGGGGNQGIVVYRSVDGGVTFSNGVLVSPTRAHWWVQNPANCGSAGALIQTSIVATATATSLAWDDYSEDSPADCGAPCNTGNPCRSRSYLARSTSGGTNWTAPVRVTPPEFESGDQFFTWLTGAGEMLYLVQRSSHESFSRKGAHTWLLESQDGGDSWAPLARLSSDTSNILVSGFWQGDYIGAAASATTVVGAWTDLREITTELYAAAVKVDAGLAITAAFSGAWYDPTQSGHGFLLQVLPDGTVLIYWFTFDAEGNPVWMFGVGEVNGATITADLFFETDGPHFPPGFDPADFNPVMWGTLTITFFGCDSGMADWDSVVESFGSGSMDLQRITSTATLDCAN